MRGYSTARPANGAKTRRGIAALVSAALLILGVIAAFTPQLSCRGSSARSSIFPPTVFPPVDPLNDMEVLVIIDGASGAVDSPNLVVAVVDRLGRILGLWRRDLTTDIDDVNKAVAIARTAAFLSSSQAPLSSRTLEFISTHHFPATFAQPEAPPAVLQDPTITTLPEQRITTGVGFTPQGPLWQIFSTNRGARLDDAANPYTAGMAFPRPGAYDSGSMDFQSFPGPGLGYLPGGVPLYKTGRLVGAIGCYIPNVDATDPIAAPSSADVLTAEFAAVSGASSGLNFAFRPIPDEGAIFLVGVLLPYLQQTSRPAGVGTGVVASMDAAGKFLDTDSVMGGVQMSRDGQVDPFGFLIPAIDDPLGAPGLTAAEVMSIIDQGIITANGTRAAIRLPVGTPTKMILAICNTQGLILGAFRMEDAPIFSLDVSVTKARNVMYFSSQEAIDNGEFGTNGSLFDNYQGSPVAITNRTLGFLTQPFYPPGIDTSAEVPGPLFQDLAVQTSRPINFNRQGSQPIAPLQSGVVFFPGAAPLYRNGILIGGFGVSGDGVEEDDFVTHGGVTKAVQGSGTLGFEPPTQLRADMYFHSGVRLPYLKFPQLPGSGNGPP